MRAPGGRIGDDRSTLRGTQAATTEAHSQASIGPAAHDSGQGPRAFLRSPALPSGRRRTKDRVGALGP